MRPNLKIFFLLFSLFCAKKALPPSPDRFPPRLEEITPQNRTTLLLTFDEAIREGKFSLFAPEETVEIRAVRIRERKVTLFTRPLRKKTYTLIGEVLDQEKNLRSLNLKFTASEERDTIPPRIREMSLLREGLEVKFSEPMETTKLFFLIQPIKRESVSPSWSNDFERLALKIDGLPSLSYLSFLLLPSLTDLEGNKLKSFGLYNKFFDTLISTQKQEGKVLLGEKGVSEAILFFSGPFRLFLLTNGEGNFKIDLPDGVYSVSAVYDEDNDGLIDFIHSSDLEVLTEPIFLRLQPEKEKRDLKDLFN